jgi:hypothetical protein
LLTEAEKVCVAPKVAVSVSHRDQRPRPPRRLRRRMVEPRKQAEPVAETVVKPQTRRVNREGIGVTRGELRQVVAQVAPVRQRERVHQRLQQGARALPRRQRRHRDDGELRLPHAHAFVGEEKEAAVAPLVAERPEGPPGQPDRPAQYAAELVVAHRRARQVAAVAEPVVRVQLLVAEVFEQRPVVLVRARARDERNLRARRAPELRRVGRGLNAELLQGVHRDQIVRRPERSRRRNRPRTALAQPRAEVGAHAVHREVVGVRALPVD